MGFYLNKKRLTDNVFVSKDSVFYKMLFQFRSIFSAVSTSLKQNANVQRMISTTPVQHHICAGRTERSKFLNKPMTYEQSFLPEEIGEHKGLLSHHTGNLHGEKNAFQMFYEDQFIRKFIYGTFYRLTAGDNIVVKRRFNIINVTMFTNEHARKGQVCFLKGYSEELLSAFLKCIVKIHIHECSADDMIYRYK